MLFRIAEFEKVKGKQVFKKFVFKGYKMGQGGEITHPRKKISTTDKRRKNYIEFNAGVGQKDIKGKNIFENDFVFDWKNKVNGIIKYYNNMGAYILRVDAGKIEVPYSVLDTDELSLEIMGNIYENERILNKWKR